MFYSKAYHSQYLFFIYQTLLTCITSYKKWIYKKTTFLSSACISYILYRKVLTVMHDVFIVLYMYELFVIKGK